jgi:hypothetical protein
MKELTGEGTTTAPHNLEVEEVAGQEDDVMVDAGRNNLMRCEHDDVPTTFRKYPTT